MTIDGKITMVDITRDVCPMTHVRVKMALTAAPHPVHVRVRLREEAVKSVIASIKADGGQVTAVGRDGEFFLLDVCRGEGRQR